MTENDLMDNLKRAARILKRRAERKADWSDPAAKQEYIREYKREQRRALLDTLVPDRRCKLCGRTRPKSTQWVVFDARKFPRLKWPTRKGAVCRGCHRRLVNNERR